MKKILCLLFVLSTNISAMENTSSDDLNQFSSTDSIPAHEEAFFDLPYDKVVTIIKALNVRGPEDSAFDWAVRWASKNCRKNEQLENLLLHIRYRGLTESFIKHVVSKAPLLFTKIKFTEDEQHEREKIITLLINFHRMAEAIKNNENGDDKELQDFITSFDEKQKKLRLPPRAEPENFFRRSFIFENVHRWSLKERDTYYSQGIYLHGYYFYVVLKFAPIENANDIDINKNFEPHLMIRCFSKLLGEIKSDNNDDKIINVAVDITIKKLFPAYGSSSLATQMYEFKNIFELLGGKIPMVPRNWHEALEYRRTVNELLVGVGVLNDPQVRQILYTNRGNFEPFQLAPFQSVILEKLYSKLQTKDPFLTLASFPTTEIAKIHSALIKLIAEDGLVDFDANNNSNIYFEILLEFNK